MRQAIVTKYLPPTTWNGSRVKAKCVAGSLTVPWDSAMSVEENHAFAAKQLFMRLGWDKENRLIGGCHAKDGYVFVQLGKGVKL